MTERSEENAASLVAISSSNLWKFRYILYVVAVISATVASPFLFVVSIQYSFVLFIAVIGFWLLRRSQQPKMRIIANIGTAFFLTTLIIQIVFFVLLAIALLSMLGRGGL